MFLNKHDSGVRYYRKLFCSANKPTKKEKHFVNVWALGETNVTFERTAVMMI